MKQVSILYDLHISSETILVTFLSVLHLAVLELGSALVRLRYERYTAYGAMRCMPDSPDLIDSISILERFRSYLASAIARK